MHSYRPTVHYVYHPCDDAVKSLHELAGNNLNQQSRQRLIKDEVVAGGLRSPCPPPSLLVSPATPCVRWPELAIDPVYVWRSWFCCCNLTIRHGRARDSAGGPRQECVLVRLPADDRGGTAGGTPQQRYLPAGSRLGSAALQSYSLCAMKLPSPHPSPCPTCCIPVAESLALPRRCGVHPALSARGSTSLFIPSCLCPPACTLLPMPSRSHPPSWVPWYGPSSTQQLASLRPTVLTSAGCWRWRPRTWGESLATTQSGTRCTYTGMTLCVIVVVLLD
jgi:hypothetical protein